MYDCACRPTNFAPSSTGPQVGPGSYDTHLHTTFGEDVVANTAPFLSWASRETNIPSEARNNARSFRPLEKWDTGKGAWFSKATSRRFQLPAYDGPGPDTYDIEDVIGKSMLCSAVRSPADRGDFDPRQHPGMLVLTRMKYCLYNAVPSIPDRRSVGYMQGSDGYLRKAIPPPPKIDKPEDLAMSSIERSRSSRMYRGPRWAARTESRLPFWDYPAPGPADYQSYQMPSFDLIHFPREPLYLPRYLDKHLWDKKKESVPGPGAYDLMEPKVMRELPCLPPFNTSASRFRYVQLDVPGPGAYHNPKAIKASRKRKSFLVEKVPFDSLDERFKIPTKDQTPDPAAYSIRGFGEEIKTRAKMRPTPAPFGSCSTRFEGPSSFVQIQKPGNPGPGMYETCPQPGFLPSPQKSRSTFTSTRKSVSKIKKQETRPEPGDHDLTRARTYLFQPTSHWRPMTPKSEKIKAVGFLSSSARFPTRPSRPTSRKPPSDTVCLPKKKPGVGPRWVRPTERPPLSFLASRIRLWRASRPEERTYKAPLGYTDSVLKGTFNVTLGNPYPRIVAEPWRPLLTPSTARRCRRIIRSPQYPIRDHRKFNKPKTWGTFRNPYN